MPARELLQPANLVSLLRVALILPLAYYLSLDDGQSTLICLALMVVAGISDGLDGFLARRLNQVTRLGIALDPIADKLFVGALVVLLVLYREFPIWLAVVVLGRDLLILGLGFTLLRGRTISLPSNLTGKYAFAALAVLLTSYLIRFEFGIEFVSWIVVALLAASMVSYGRLFLAVRRGMPPPQFQDRPLYFRLRVFLTSVFSIFFLFKLAQFAGFW
jgi:cardiolipin synthase